MRTPYKVFVDETFDGFMNLHDLDGHFCYGALMVPDSRIQNLERFFKALDVWLREKYLQATGHAVNGEFKSTYLGKLSKDLRREMCRKIAYFLNKNTGFIAGYYTTVHGLMCWEIRSEEDTLPPYSRDLVESRKARFLVESKKTHGESEILRNLFHSIAVIPCVWLGRIDASYELIYDSRDHREDRLLLDPVNQFMPKMDKLGSELGDVYLKSRASTQSESGLMLVDLICKELRNFVKETPFLLRDRSDFQLITDTSREGEFIPYIIDGVRYKWGSSISMSENTLDELSNNESHPFSQLLKHLADGKLSCNAHFGEGRLIDFQNKCFNQAVDR